MRSPGAPRTISWSFQRDALTLTPPALRESHQGGFARRREAVCRGSVALMAVGQRPHPRRAAGRRREGDTADDLAVGHHVVSVRSRRTDSGRAEDQGVVHLAVKFASRPPASCYFAPKNCLPMPDRAGAAVVLTSTTGRCAAPDLVAGERTAAAAGGRAG